ncbi:MSC_0620 family F1-like ATPase-associated subunit [Metamycoplasma buccale]|uniref:MSC_0620 family F1-like ATPase-associated subunit n=1 Tax=Metamycoplasma buccale TaxID=55602 RepID=UPI00398E8B24
MSKKIKPFLLLGSALVLPIMPAISLASAKSLREDPKNPEPKKEISPLFDTFDTNAKKEIKKGIENAHAAITSFLENELAKTKNLKDGDYKKKLEKIIYLQALIKFFKENKEQILAKPADFGLHVTFPYVLSQNKKYNIGKITYNNKTYDGVKIGNTEDSNYTKPVAPKGIITKEKEEDNFTSNEDFSKVIDSYVKAMLAEFSKIVYNEKDIPEIDKDITLDPNDSLGLAPSIPKGFSSWKDYIIAKIHPRFVEFDLNQNKDLGDPKPNNPANPSNPPAVTPPLVPNQSQPGEPKVSIDTLPILNPEVSSEYVYKDASSLSSFYTSASEEEKKKVFFFNNPINTRYKYEVAQLTSNGDTLTAVVTISDRVKPELKRSYTIENIKVENTEAKKARQTLYKSLIEMIQTQYKRLYEAMGIDDKLDYVRLGNQNLVSALYSMIDGAIKIANGEKFNKYEEQLLNQYIKYWKAGNSNQTLTRQIANNAWYNALNAMSSTTIDQKGYWYLLAKGFEYLYEEYKDAIRVNNRYLVSNYKNNNLDMGVISRLLEKIGRDTFRLKSIASAHPLDIISWYNEYIQAVKELKAQYILLSKIAITKQVMPNTDDGKALKEAYNQVQNVLNNQNKNQNKFEIIFGSILIAIGLLAIIADLTILIIKRQSAKQKKILLLYILIAVFALIMVISGVALTLIGALGL